MKVRTIPNYPRPEVKAFGGIEMIGYTKISRQSFYRGGGFANPRHVRVTRGKAWAYFVRVQG